jgi:hypothetical protein
VIGNGVKARWVVLAGAVGLFAGGGGSILVSSWAMKSTQSLAFQLSAAREVAWEGEEAVRTYLDASRSVDTKRYALVHYIAVLESYVTLDEQVPGVKADLGLTYGRLGRVLDAAQEPEKARQAYAKARAVFSDIGRPFESDVKLIERIDTLDEAVRAARGGVASVEGETPSR